MALFSTEDLMKLLMEQSSSMAALASGAPSETPTELPVPTYAPQLKAPKPAPVVQAPSTEPTPIGTDELFKMMTQGAPAPSVPTGKGISGFGGFEAFGKGAVIEGARQLSQEFAGLDRIATAISEGLKEKGFPEAISNKGNIFKSLSTKLDPGDIRDMDADTLTYKIGSIFGGLGSLVLSILGTKGLTGLVGKGATAALGKTIGKEAAGKVAAKMATSETGKEAAAWAIPPALQTYGASGTAGEAAAEGLLSGLLPFGIFQSTRSLPRVARAGILGGYGAGEAIARGEDLTDIDTLLNKLAFTTLGTLPKARLGPLDAAILKNRGVPPEIIKSMSLREAQLLAESLRKSGEKYKAPEVTRPYATPPIEQPTEAGKAPVPMEPVQMELPLRERTSTVPPMDFTQLDLGLKAREPSPVIPAEPGKVPVEWLPSRQEGTVPVQIGTPTDIGALLKKAPERKLTPNGEKAVKAIEKEIEKKVANGEDPTPLESVKAAVVAQTEVPKETPKKSRGEIALEKVLGKKEPPPSVGELPPEEVARLKAATEATGVGAKIDEALGKLPEEKKISNKVKLEDTPEFQETRNLWGENFDLLPRAEQRRIVETGEVPFRKTIEVGVNRKGKLRDLTIAEKRDLDILGMQGLLTQVANFHIPSRGNVVSALEGLVRKGARNIGWYEVTVLEPLTQGEVSDLIGRGISVKPDGKGHIVLGIGKQDVETGLVALRKKLSEEIPMKGVDEPLLYRIDQVKVAKVPQVVTPKVKKVPVEVPVEAMEKPTIPKKQVAALRGLGYSIEDISTMSKEQASEIIASKTKKPVEEVIPENAKVLTPEEIAKAGLPKEEKAKIRGPLLGILAEDVRRSDKGIVQRRLKEQLFKSEQEELKNRGISYEYNPETGLTTFRVIPEETAASVTNVEKVASNVIDGSNPLKKTLKERKSRKAKDPESEDLLGPQEMEALKDHGIKPEDIPSVEKELSKSDLPRDTAEAINAKFIKSYPYTAKYFNDLSLSTREKISIGANGGKIDPLTAKSMIDDIYSGKIEKLMAERGVDPKTEIPKLLQEVRKLTLEPGNYEKYSKAGKELDGVMRYSETDLPMSSAAQARQALNEGWAKYVAKNSKQLGGIDITPEIVNFNAILDPITMEKQFSRAKFSNMVPLLDIGGDPTQSRHPIIKAVGEMINIGHMQMMNRINMAARFYKEFIQPLEADPNRTKLKEAGKYLHELAKAEKEGAKPPTLPTDPQVADLISRWQGMVKEFDNAAGLTEKGLGLSNYVTRIIDYDKILGFFRSQKGKEELGTKLTNKVYADVTGIIESGRKWKDMTQMEKETLKEYIFRPNGLIEWEHLPAKLQKTIPKEKWHSFFQERKENVPEFIEKSIVKDLGDIYKTYTYSTIRAIYANDVLSKVTPVINSLPESAIPGSVRHYLESLVRHQIFRARSLSDVYAQKALGAFNSALKAVAPQLAETKLVRDITDRPRLATDISKGYAGAMYRGALGLDTAFINLTQALNNVFEVGPKNTAVGVYKAFWERLRGGEKYKWWKDWQNTFDEFKDHMEQGTDPGTKGLKHYYLRMGQLALSPMHFSENILRFTTFMAGLEDAAAKGIPWERAVRIGLGKSMDIFPDMTVPEAAWHALKKETATQFRYSGAHVSPYLQSPLARISSIFWSYPLKSAQFARNLLLKEGLGDPSGSQLRGMAFIGMHLTLAAALAQMGFDLSHIFGKGIMPAMGVPAIFTGLKDAYTSVTGETYAERSKAQDNLLSYLGTLAIPQYRWFFKKVPTTMDNIKRGYEVYGINETPIGETNTFEQVMKLLGVKPEWRGDMMKMRQIYEDVESEHDIKRAELAREYLKSIEDGNHDRAAKIMEQAIRSNIQLDRNTLRYYWEKRQRPLLEQDIKRAPRFMKEEIRKRQEQYYKQHGTRPMYANPKKYGDLYPAYGSSRWSSMMEEGED